MKSDTLKITLLVALLLILGGSASVYFLWFRDDVPLHKGNSPLASHENKPKPPELNARDFEPGPDPVVTQKPENPVVLDSSKPLKRMVINGRVLDEAGLPIADVKVDFQGQGALSSLHGSGTTDPSGRYSMLAWERVSSRRTLSGSDGGWVYARATNGRAASGAAQAFELRALVEMPDLKLAAQGAIDGRVVDANGEPAPFVQVNLRSNGTLMQVDESGVGASQQHRQVVRSAISNERGQFSFSPLPPGVFSLTVESGYFGVTQQRAEVDISDGSTRWQELALVQLNVVRGRLLDQEGQPIEGAVVLLKQASEVKATSGEVRSTDPKNFEATPETRRISERGRDFRSAVNQWRSVTDCLGRFGFSNVHDVEFVLHAAIGKSRTELNDVHINRGDYSLTLALDSSIAGIVRDALTFQPIYQFDVRISATSGQAASSPFDRVQEDAMFPWHDSGRFRVINASTGNVCLRISAKGYVPALLNVSNLAQGQRLVGQDVMLVPLCELHLTLKQGNKLLPREPVILMFDDRAAYEAASDEFGEVKLPGVAPGNYGIRVQRADGSLLQATLAVPAKSSHTTSVELAPK